MLINHPWNADIPAENAALWFLGQAGYYMKSGGCTVMIDPYLTDSVGKSSPLFSRVYPPPVNPAEVKADIFIVTHDHTDHLDPETIGAYAHKDTTMFVSPRHAAKHLAQLGIPAGNIIVVDHGDTAQLPGMRVSGVFALSTDPGTIDTAGYLLTFYNGKSVYHTSDTAFCDLLLKACPKKVDVLLTSINGKWGNLNIAQSIELTRAVSPRYVIPNHYDVMELNSEKPESFRYFYGVSNLDAECVILPVLKEFRW